MIDYSNALITLKKNNKFKEKFSYNKSGLELAHNGVRFVKEYEPSKYSVEGNKGSQMNSGGVRIVLDREYKMKLKPAYAIVELREGSPAYKAGLKKGDVILSINGKSTHQLKLQQIMAMFYGHSGKLMKLKVERNTMVLSYAFKLESLLE